jgi:hypothetical protein
MIYLERSSRNRNLNQGFHGAGDPQSRNSTTDFADNTDKRATIRVKILSGFIRDISEIRG